MIVANDIRQAHSCGALSNGSNFLTVRPSTRGTPLSIQYLRAFAGWPHPAPLARRVSLCACAQLLHPAGGSNGVTRCVYLNNANTLRTTGPNRSRWHSPKAWSVWPNSCGQFGRALTPGTRQPAQCHRGDAYGHTHSLFHTRTPFDWMCCQRSLYRSTESSAVAPPRIAKARERASVRTRTPRLPRRIKRGTGYFCTSKSSILLTLTARKSACTAFIADVGNAPPTSAWQLTIIKKTTQKAAN